MHPTLQPTPAPHAATHSLLLLLLLLLALLAPLHASAGSCPYFGDRESAPSYSLPNCTFFQPDSCCTRTEVASLFSSLPPLHKASASCVEHMNFMQCNLCSPLQANFLDSSSAQARMCVDMCETVYSRCKGARFGSRDGPSLASLYGNGRAMCEANGFVVVDTRRKDVPLSEWDNLECFTFNEVRYLVSPASSAPAPAAWTLAALAALAVASSAPRRAVPLALLALALAAAALPRAEAGGEVAPQYCPFFGNRPAEERRDLRNCTVHRRMSCALNEEIDALFSRMPPIEGAGSDCRYIFTHAMCWVADADQARIYSVEEQRATLCESLCDKVLRRCAKAVYKGLRFHEVWETGADMCRDLRFDVYPDNGAARTNTRHNLPCYGSPAALAARPPPAALALLLPALAAAAGGGRLAAAAAGAAAALLALARPAEASSRRFHSPDPVDDATMTRWASAVGADLDSLAEDGLRVHEMQAVLDEAGFDEADRSGADVVRELQETLSDFFAQKTAAVNRLAEAAERAYLDFAELGGPDRAWDADPPHYDSDIGPAPPGLADDSLFRTAVSRHNSTIKLSDDTPRGSKAVRDAVAYGAALDDTMRANLRADPSVRWQYFGSASGVFRQFPGKRWGVNHVGVPTEYSNLERPWYVLASSSPKSVAVIIDCSGSMRGRDGALGRDVAKALIRSLSAQDLVNVFCARSVVPRVRDVGWRYTPPYALSCHESNMVPATPSHKEQLLRAVDEIDYRGGSDLLQGFDMAFRALRNGPVGTEPGSVPACQPFVAFVGDGNDDGEEDNAVCRRTCNDDGCTNHYCGYTQVMRELPFNVDLLNSVRYRVNAKIFSYNVVHRGEKVMGQTACLSGGHHQYLRTNRNLRAQMEPLYRHLAVTSRREGVQWTAPYLDASGLGLMVTAVRTVYDRTVGAGETPHLLGVVGVDVTLDVIEELLSNGGWGTAYGFLVQGDGAAVVHPLLRPTAEIGVTPIFPDVTLLEDSPEFAAFVRPDLLAGRPGQRTMTTTRRLPRGDLDEGVSETVQRTVYHYGPVANSSFSLVYALADPADRTERVPRAPSEEAVAAAAAAFPPSSSPSPPPVLYHRLDLYEEGFPAEARRAGVTAAGDELRPGPLSPNTTSVKLAQSAFCNPNSYARARETGRDLLRAHLLLNQGARAAASAAARGATQCASDGRDTLRQGLASLRPGVAEDVLLTSLVRPDWLARGEDTLRDVVWTYVGTVNGVFASMPAARWPHSFAPERRSWWHRAYGRNPAVNAVSAPYVDAAGAGRVVTVSRQVMEGRPAAGACPADDEEGLPDGCPCSSGSQCASRYCYAGVGASDDAAVPRCAASRTHGVMGLDFLYKDFGGRVLAHLDGGPAGRGCDTTYACDWQDGAECSTRCYLIDDSALLLVAPEFRSAPATDRRLFSGVALGREEPDVMRRLVYEHGVFERVERVDFQGACAVSPPPAVALPLNMSVEAQDRRAFFVGEVPPFTGDEGCVKDIATYSLRDGSDGRASGSVNTACRGADYALAPVPNSNALLLVLTNWYNYSRAETGGRGFGWNCAMQGRLFDVGGFEVVNGTCEDTSGEDAGAPPVPCLERLYDDPDLECKFGAGFAAAPGAALLVAAAAAGWWLAL